MGFFMPAIFAVFGIGWVALTLYLGETFMSIFGFICIAAAVFMAVIEIKDRILRKRYEEDPEAYEMQFADEEEIEEEPIEAQYDVDSGKGYCPHCGNYSVSENKCEVCGKEVTE